MKNLRYFVTFHHTNITYLLKSDINYHHKIESISQSGHVVFDTSNTRQKNRKNCQHTLNEYFDTKVKHAGAAFNILDYEFSSTQA
jgi:hypothetical protein